MYALPSLGNITVCVVVVFFVFGIVGVDLFGRITFIDNSALDADRNFRDLYHAIVLLFTYAGCLRTHISYPTCPQHRND